jgi:hypothetical protein
MNLKLCTQLDAIDPLPSLGKKVEPKPAEAPKEVEVAPGILRDAEGKLRTNLPENEVARRWPRIDSITMCEAMPEIQRINAILESLKLHPRIRLKASGLKASEL